MSVLWMALAAAGAVAEQPPESWAVEVAARYGVETNIRAAP